MEKFPILYLLEKQKLISCLAGHFEPFFEWINKFNKFDKLV